MTHPCARYHIDLHLRAFYFDKDSKIVDGPHARKVYVFLQMVLRIGSHLPMGSVIPAQYRVVHSVLAKR